ncbi:molybdate ABC transporter substrate-binding protein [Oleiagrimonas soli]|nr:molybdate ABC transporter substrate-binding protein [Oleiagrimonas soli]MBB6185009.1 molybdate transport system substrate-binding protein [Oleiagrimonas soli]
MRACARLLLAVSLLLPLGACAAPGRMVIAAAASLHDVMGRLVTSYRAAHPGARIDVVYGSSGILLTQIRQGAPFDLFFSADSGYPQQLADASGSDGPPAVYALGRLVLWSRDLDLAHVRLADLVQPRFGRIAIANPQHAPYGLRAEQALRAAGVWSALQPRLVQGENIAQAAQFARSGNARVGLLAASLTQSPAMRHGHVAAVPDAMYRPLRQSFVVTRHGADNALAHDFAHYARSAPARALFARYGFGLPAKAH